MSGTPPSLLAQGRIIIAFARSSRRASAAFGHANS